MLTRRTMLKVAGSVPLAVAGLRSNFAASADPAATSEKADYTIKIATGLVELAPDHIVSTTLYNGQFPGPLLRFKEGQRVLIDVQNDTDTPELVHWHGQMVPSEVDGASEEGTPFVPAHSTYTGQAGPVYIDPKSDPGAYDREIFLVLKEFSPTFSRGGDMAMEALTGSELPELKARGKKADAEAKAKTKGYEVGYEFFSINGRMLGHGEPVRVKQGERVLFHVLNASAGEIRSLACR